MGEHLETQMALLPAKLLGWAAGATWDGMGCEDRGATGPGAPSPADATPDFAD